MADTGKNKRKNFYVREISVFDNFLRTSCLSNMEKKLVQN